jgi:trimeric autotransporter adhesin
VPLICAGGCTMAPSDRNLKRDFAPIDGEQILNSLAELPITSWRYKTESGDARHIGPMAQDFKARFGVGTDDKYILQVDADGVALAAIKTLNDRVNRLAKENAELRREISRLHVSKTKTH